MAGRSLIAIAVSLAMVTVVLNVVHTASSEMIVSGHCLGGTGDDRGNAVEIDSSGNVYLAGDYYDSASMNTKGFIAKFASDGSLSWNLGLQYMDSYTSVIDLSLDSDGNVYMLLGAPVSMLAKVTPSGTVAFAEDLTGLNYAYRVAYNPANGGAVVVGDRYDYGEGVVASFSSMGTELWSRNFASDGWASPWGVTVDASGNIYAVMDRSDDDVSVIEFSPIGNITRQVRLATATEPEYSWDITLDSSGNVYVLGLETRGMHALVAKMTSTLAPVWTEYLVTSNSWQECLRLAIASDGSIYAIGQGTSASANYSGGISFHLANDGAPLESSIYAGNGISMLYFNDAEVSPAGAVILAGISYGAPVLVPAPIPDVVATPPSGSWTSDNASWISYSLGAMSASLDPYVPDMVADNYDSSYAAQAWFGTVGTPELTTSIDVRASSPDSFQFRGSVSGGKKPYTYSWNFGDGTMETGKRVTHTYGGPGQYAVVLIVTDSAGSFGFASTTVRVTGPPVISYMYVPNPTYVNTYTSMFVNAYDPDGGAIISYAWDFGDGTSIVGVDPWASHVYTVAGGVNVTLTVTDDEGDFTIYQVYTDVLANPNLLPVAIFTMSPTPIVGSPVTFNGLSSFDPDGYITQYAWWFGDGYVSNGSVTTHMYASVGTYYASLTVTDNMGATASTGMNLTVYEQGAAKNWTFLVYLDADNNLEEVGSVDFMEMSSVGSDSNINIVVEMDRSPYYDMSFGDWTTTKRFYVTPGLTPYYFNALQDLGELDMGDAQTLADFITWGVSAYPAENYALILWDHGGGWDGAVCWDDTNNDALSLDEVESALDQASNSTGARINLLGFDACLMGMVEVAYEVMDQVDFIAFSEETVPWDGLPYDAILWDLKSYPLMTARDLGNDIVYRYMDFYTNQSIGNSSYFDPYVTMASMDMSASSSLYTAIQDFAMELLLAIPNEQEQILSCLWYTERFAYQDYVDLYDFAQKIYANTSLDGLRDAALAVMNSIEATLTSEGHGFMHPQAHGLSIFFPMTNSTYIDYYANTLDFTAAFSWDEFLIAELMIPDDQYEPDNDYLHATPIAHGETQIHSISDGGLDQDWLMFEVPEPNTEVRVNTSGPPNVWTDTVIQLYDAYGVPYWPIAIDDDGGVDGCSIIQMFLNQSTYYVNVTAYGMGFEIPWYGVSVYIGDIPNMLPYAWIDYWPYDPGVGSQVYFSAYAFDPDGYITDIMWDFGDNTSGTGGQNYTVHVFDAPGDYVVTLTVTDNDGGQATASTVVHVVMNLMPVAAMSYYPSLPNPYDTVFFDGTMSYDPDGYIQNYYWEFGDGYASSSSYTYHYYYQGGMYLVTLTVTDNRGATNSTSTWVHVNMPPVAVIVPSVEMGKVGAPVTFDGSGSYDPEGSPITSYTWYFSDGGNETGPIVTHTFFEVGYYYVHLQVREENGSWGSVSLEFAVSAAVPPAAIIGYSPSNPLVGEDVTFDGSSSVDPDGSIVTYIWQLGDGTVATGVQVVHAYAVPGTYEVQLTVIDEDKLIDDGVTKITVVSKPIAGFEHSPASPVAGDETAFYAVGSYDPMGITLYVWSFGDGTYAQGWQVSHTFTAPGDYSVALTVTNAAGVQATLSKTVSVAAAPLTPTVSNTADLGWEETSEPGIEPLILALCAISMAIGCLVGDVVVGFGQRKKGT